MSNNEAMKKETVYNLYVSRDAGCSYRVEATSTIDQLRPHMKRCDDDWLRWYLEDAKTGEMEFARASKIHSGILTMVQAINETNQRIHKTKFTFIDGYIARRMGYALIVNPHGGMYKNAWQAGWERG